MNFVANKLYNAHHFVPSFAQTIEVRERLAAVCDFLKDEDISLERLEATSHGTLEATWLVAVDNYSKKQVLVLRSIAHSWGQDFVNPVGENMLRITLTH